MTKTTALTCFGKQCWHRTAKQMIQSFVQHWPKDVHLLVVMDPDCEEYLAEVRSILREGDMATSTTTKERWDWLKAQKPDESNDYRRHYVRFSHKVWAIDMLMQS